VQGLPITEVIMVRRRSAAASAALSALAALAALSACTSSDATPDSNADDTTATQPSDSTTTPPPDKPIDITAIPEDTRLEPGTYSMPFFTGDDTARAIVDVPDGYTNFFSVISSVDGDMAFWGKVTQVDTDPCLGGKHVSAGSSVHDLASLLVAQRHMKTTQPVPVTIGGYHGVYVKITAPADIDRCRGGTVTILTAGGTWLQLDVPSATFHEWILNVRGTRVVGGARMGPDSPYEDGLIAMVESARFNLG
jgi:hypothetical protein